MWKFCQQRRRRRRRRPKVVIIPQEKKRRLIFSGASSSTSLSSGFDFCSSSSILINILIVIMIASTRVSYSRAFTPTALLAHSHHSSQFPAAAAARQHITTTTTRMAVSSSSFIGQYRMRIITHPSSKVGYQRTRCNKYYGSSGIKMMPEGPEVRTLVDQLQDGIGKRLIDIQFLSGRYLNQRPVGFQEFAATMTPLLRSPHDYSNTIPSATDIGSKTVDTIIDWNCKGKFIYILLDDGATTAGTNSVDNKDIQDDDDDDENENESNDYQRSIWITLGMTGRFVNENKHIQDPSYGRWVLELVNNVDAISDYKSYANDETSSSSQYSKSSLHKVFYHDKRNFGTVKFCLSKKEFEMKLNSLGPDVLALAREDTDPIFDEESQRIFLDIMDKQRNKEMNICKFLMDQKKISGVGNYILSEALYRSDIDPFCGIDELSTKSQRLALFEEIKNVIFESYMSQQQSQSQKTSKNDSEEQDEEDEKGSPTNMGYTSVQQLDSFEFEFQCYGKKTCPNGNEVIRESNGPHGRTIWYTEQQLFMSRQERKRQQLGRELEQQRQKKKQESASTSSLSSSSPSKTMPVSTSSIVMDSNISSSSTSAATTLQPLIDGITDPGWKDALEPYMSTSESFRQLEEYLRMEYQTYGEENIYPPRHQIFDALNLCPLQDVKLVILGQDPYHGPNQAMGLSFSVSKDVTKIPPSLRNIFKELHNDIIIDGDGGSQQQEGSQQPQPQHGDLIGWAKQGVLMLNTVLTVQRGKANSHQRKGWEKFTDEIVRILLLKQNDTGGGGGGIVFLLWGAPATKKAKSIIDNDSDSDNDNDNSSSKKDVVVITTSHPSPLGATKTNTPFLSSKCFSRSNQALVEMGLDPIDWYRR
jgi:uracil-DNA glycosylase